MIVDCFVDTNVCLYAVSPRGELGWKRDRAFEILDQREFGLSAQVLQEFFVCATRKIKAPLSVSEASIWVDRLSLRPVVPVDDALVKTAIHISSRFKISYWDGAIIAAAEALSAPILYTEDLNDQQLYGSVRAINPFGPH